MNKLDLSLHYNDAIVTTDFSKDQSILSNPSEVISLINEMMNLGFVPSEQLMTLLYGNDLEIGQLYDELLPALRILVGDNVDHTPMYPNFPEQVAEMTNFELYFNAVMHYSTFGQWMPEFEVHLREAGLEPNVKYKVIDAIQDEALWNKIDKVVLSPDSITAFDKAAIKWTIENNKFTFNEDFVSKIVFAETRCIILAEFLKNKDLASFNTTVNNMTDILRVATYLSDGDVSLAKNTKFRNFKRAERRFLTQALQANWDDETASRHWNKWVKLLHQLHVGDYSKVVWEAAKKLRENEHIATFNGNVERRIALGDLEGAMTILKSRPADFARRLDHLLRSSSDPKVVITEFDKVLNKVPSKILIQLYGHFANRTTTRKTVVLPKGNEAKAVLIDQKGELAPTVTKTLLLALRNALMMRFGKEDLDLGKVYIDPRLKVCPVPSAMRSVKAGLNTVPRGTKYDIGDDKFLRFFVYWVGRDIDLSATFHDEDFKMVSQVSYTRLQSSNIEAYHSGDITSAFDGASEFIDINIVKAARVARYVAMNVLVFAGPKFSEHEEAFVGWMSLQQPNHNEIFNPKTVKNCVSLTNETKYVCPVIFDLVERKAIFVDMTKDTGRSWCNNVEANQAGIEDLLYAAVNPKKMSLYELFELHSLKFTDVVSDKTDADFTFDLEDGDITPADWAEIQTDWMGN